MRELDTKERESERKKGSERKRGKRGGRERFSASRHTLMAESVLTNHTRRGAGARGNEAHIFTYISAIRMYVQYILTYTHNVY